MKKTRLPVILATSLWTLASAVVLVLNLSAAKLEPFPVKNAWWLGHTIGELRISKELQSQIEKYKLGNETFDDFSSLKVVFDHGDNEAIALYALANLSGVDSAKPLEANSFDKHAFDSLPPETLSLVASSITSLAQFDLPNIDKLSWVKLGQELLDLAVQRDAKNPLPHRVRYYNNEALPDFLKRPDLSAVDANFLEGVQK